MNENSVSHFKINVSGTEYTVTRKTYPFREGVELEVEIEDEKIRVSDRQLGEKEAISILSQIIQKKVKP